MSRCFVSPSISKADHTRAICSSVSQSRFIDSSCERLGKQIRTAELEKIPVVAVVGKKEVENQTLSVRTRQAGDLGAMTLTELLRRLEDVLIAKTGI